MYEQLLEIYREFGLYKEKLISVEKEGKVGGRGTFKRMMDNSDKVRQKPLMVPHDRSLWINLDHQMP